MLSKTTLFLSIVAITCGTALGQPTTERQWDQRQAQQGTQQAESLESHLAAGIALGNHEEVVLSQLAKDRARNDRVKGFADSMIREHQSAIAKFQPFLPAVVAMVLRSAADERAQSETGAYTTMRPFAGSKLLQIELQTAKNCVDLAKSELSQKQGDAFDRAYMAEQIAAHIVMLARLRAIEPAVSGELRDLVHNGIETTQKHLDEAKSIAQQIEPKST